MSPQKSALAFDDSSTESMTEPYKLSRYGYRKELLELLGQLVRDMDRKIERQKDRAAKESEARVPTPPEQTQLEELKVCLQAYPLTCHAVLMAVFIKLSAAWLHIGASLTSKKLIDTIGEPEITLL